MQHTKALSADEYEGRGPGTKGEELTVKYLADQFQRLGLKPGNPDGTYVQKVPLAGFTGQPTASFTAGDKKIDLKFGRLRGRLAPFCGAVESLKLRHGVWLRR